MQHSEKNNHARLLTAADCESNDAYLQNTLMGNDHLEQLKEKTQEGLQKYKDVMGDFVGYPPEQKLATLAQLLELDDIISLDKLADELLDEVQHIIYGHIMLHGNDPKLLMDRVFWIHKLAKALWWIKAYGCSK